MRFMQWLETVKFSKAEKIAQGLKNYKPGTFGVEIEFYMSEDSYQPMTYGAPKPDEDAIKNTIEEYVHFLTNIGENANEGNSTTDSWGVGLDGVGTEGLMEIRTKIMKENDFSSLLKFLSYVKKERFNGGTSAHVHIGMPSNTDAFDLLAMSTLVDEEEIRKFAGENRQFDDFAKFNKQLHGYLSEHLKDGVYSNQEVLGVVHEAEKDFGTNLKSFFKFGTVEFRYLSSQIVNNPIKFIEFIKYFLMLPNIAQSRNRIMIGEKTVTRLPGGKIQFSSGRTSQPSYNDIRNTNDNTNKYVKIITFNKIKDIKLSEFIYKTRMLDKFKLLPEPTRKYLMDMLEEVRRTRPSAKIGDILQSFPNDYKDTLINVWI